MMYRRDSPAAGVETTFPGLGRDHHVVAPTAERTAEDPLGGFAFGGGGHAGR